LNAGRRQEIARIPGRKAGRHARRQAGKQDGGQKGRKPGRQAEKRNVIQLPEFFF
jgi:hypothetical protein